jgi:transposase InsO family protein
MVASGLRTMIAGSLSSCIARFHQSYRCSQSSGPRRARVDPADERRKSALGRAAHSRRTAQARVWGRAPIGFDLLYAFVIVRLDRRELVWINVTTIPTAEWIARQITEAFPWNDAPQYLIRDRDRIYGAIVTRRLRAMGIRDKPTAPASPWQNGFAERLIGTIRRECVDHIIVLGEMHLRRVLKSYADYYNSVRTHRSLNKDAPASRPVQRTGVIRSRAILGGLHHHYARV